MSQELPVWVNVEVAADGAFLGDFADCTYCSAEIDLEGRDYATFIDPGHEEVFVCGRCSRSETHMTSGYCACVNGTLFVSSRSARCDGCGAFVCERCGVLHMAPPSGIQTASLVRLLCWRCVGRCVGDGDPARAIETPPSDEIPF